MDFRIKNTATILLFSILFLFSCHTVKKIPNEKAESDIIAVMKMQELAWSDGDIHQFMEGYWKSEELKFYGNSGVTYGWDNTLARYKRSYPDKEHTGTLEFVIKEISPIENNSYYVLGEFYLKRGAGDTNGIFMIILKKIKGEWKIVADTSC